MSKKSIDIPRVFWESYAAADTLQRQRIIKVYITRSLYRLAKLFSEIDKKEKEKEDFFNHGVSSWIQSYFDDLVQIWQSDKADKGGKK